MPNIKLSIPHQLGTDDAKVRISKIAQDARSQFAGMVTDVQESWNGNMGTFGFRAMGFNITGQLDVQPACVNISVNLPLAALPFKNKLEQEMDRKARALLS